MFGLAIIETVIGIVFVYLLLSLLVTTINELYFTYFNRLRSKTLLEGLESILSDNGNTTYFNQFIEHPLIKKKMSKGRFPSYISSNTFGKVFTDILGVYKKGANTYDAVKTSIDKLPDGEHKQMLEIWFNYSDEKLIGFHKNIEEWYNEVMDRVIGWYKRKVKKITLTIGFVCAVLLNADTFSMIERLAQDDEKRKDLVELAENYQGSVNREEIKSNDAIVKMNDTLTSTEVNDKILALDKKIIEVSSELSASSNILGIGWDGNSNFEWKDNMLQNIWLIILKLTGWLITAIAITLGAPFWFDILSKAIHVKGSGKTPKTE